MVAAGYYTETALTEAFFITLLFWFLFQIKVMLQIRLIVDTPKDRLQGVFLWTGAGVSFLLIFRNIDYDLVYGIYTNAPWVEALFMYTAVILVYGCVMYYMRLVAKAQYEFVQMDPPHAVELVFIACPVVYSVLIYVMVIARGVQRNPFWGSMALLITAVFLLLALLTMHQSFTPVIRILLVHKDKFPQTSGSIEGTVAQLRRFSIVVSISVCLAVVFCIILGVNIKWYPNMPNYGGRPDPNVYTWFGSFNVAIAVMTLLLAQSGFVGLSATPRESVVLDKTQVVVASKASKGSGGRKLPPQTHSRYLTDQEPRTNPKKLEMGVAV